ncbi:MAG: A24 family peptidase [Leptolyngbyaceae cyanobacterium bins.302]|nr:A24 family peptidase [Leptolyngbyaceae cyanobacterium bins.302]
MEALLTLLVYLLVFWTGASIGSFLSVVVHRIPARLSIVQPPSHCPQCGYRLKFYENVPILGWLSLKGRCSNCRTPISARYPLLEAGCGFVFVVIFALFGLTWQTVGYWMFFAWLLALSLIDIDTMTLPNPLTQWGLIAGLLFQALMGYAATATLAGSIQQLMQGLLGAVLGIWLVDVIAIVGGIAFGQDAMGGGDAKLAAMMGAWLGWQLLLLAGFLACAIGALGGGLALGMGILSRRQAFPFGPFLALGGMIAAIWGNAIVSAYLQLFFPSL